MCIPTLLSAIPVGAGTPCPELQARCAGTCVNIMHDDANCGVCGRNCGPSTHCLNAECAP